MTCKTLFSILFAMTLVALLPAAGVSQQASIRQHYHGGWSAMRPEIFHVGRTAVVPVSSSLDRLTELGAFVDKRGAAPEELPAKLWLDGHRYPRAATTLSAACDGKTLLLLVSCSEPEPESAASAADDYYADGRVVIDLDLNHDHHTFSRIQVWPWGADTLSAHRVVEGHLAWDHRVQDLQAELNYRSSVEKTSDGWTARVEVALPTGATGWRAMGLNVQRYRGVRGEEISMWCPDYNHPGAPLWFGDLYLGKPPATVAAVALGQVTFGANRGKVILNGRGGVKSLGVETRNYKDTWQTGESSFVSNEAAFDWVLDPHDIMHGELHLALDGLPWGSYQFGWKRSILLTHRPTGRYENPRPAPGDPDYYWKFVAYVLDRLPCLERSADGTLLTDGAGIEIDLTGADPLGELAAVVMRRFATNEERLTAATMLLCQQGVMVSARIGEMLVHAQDGLGALRVGGAFCNSYGELLRDLVNRIRDEDGNLFEACVVHYVPGAVNTFGWPHHWLCGVKYGDGLTLIDAELGTVFFDPTTGGMATLQQLISNPGLADLTGYGLSEYFRGRQLKQFMVREDGDLLR